MKHAHTTDTAAGAGEGNRDVDDAPYRRGFSAPHLLSVRHQIRGQGGRPGNLASEESRPDFRAYSLPGPNRGTAQTSYGRRNMRMFFCRP